MTQVISGFATMTMVDSVTSIFYSSSNDNIRKVSIAILTFRGHHYILPIIPHHEVLSSIVTFGSCLPWIHPGIRRPSGRLSCSSVVDDGNNNDSTQRVRKPQVKGATSRGGGQVLARGMGLQGLWLYLQSRRMRYVTNLWCMPEIQKLQSS